MAQQTPEQELAERKRLPTLLEVLGRRTLAPVDLFSFYIYMRDQQRSVDYLDFWLDVSQHMSLCRHYVRELRRSMLLETPEVEKNANASKRSSQALENFGDLESTGIVGNGEKNGSEQRLSAFLRHETANGSGSTGVIGAPVSHSPSHSLASQHSNQSKTIRRPSAERPPRPSFMSTPEVHTDSNSPGHTVARADIRASAEKILYTFVLPGSEREIILPETILNRIIHAIEEEGRDDPEVFDDAKDYVFQAMERDAFPGFLQAKALGNLVPPSVIIRLSFGLASFGAAFWGGYYMILTDQPRHIRCWLILPFTIGAYLLISYQYKLDLIMALLGFSEYTFMNWSRVREPFIGKLLRTRATMAFFVFAAIAVAFSVLFIFVPGTHF